jgi:CheY-like chemotaxis protein
MSLENELQGKTVLIADDEEYIRIHIAKGLRSRGLNVLEAGSGDDVLELIKKKPHVIILDIQMPGLNGFEVAGMLKEREDTKHIPLILLSARAQESDIEKGYEMGADYYLTKPITFTQIIDALQEAINGR